MPASSKVGILLNLALWFPLVTFGDVPARTVQDGPAGYSVACAIEDQPNIHSCADLSEARACEREFDHPSNPSQAATGMTFVNRSEHTIRIYWLDREGSRKLYLTLPPNGRATQKTSIGANWLVADLDDKCIGVFKAAPESLAFF
jgi:hypothetical protein